MRYASLMATAGHQDAQLAALAAAYTSTEHADDQDRILAALAEALETHWDWQGLAAVAATQDRRHPHRGDAIAIARPRARALLATGRAAEAETVFLAIGDAPAAALAQTFRTSRPAPSHLMHGATDWDGDGRLGIPAWRGGAV